MIFGVFCFYRHIKLFIESYLMRDKIETLEKIKNTGVAAVDVSGRGGTHWGRIEGARFETNSAGFQIAETFSDWGLGTLDSLISAVEGKPDYQIWASGGVRDGLDIAKLLAVGAQLVGLAQPWLKALLQTSGNNRISLGQTDLAHDSADLRLDQYYGRLQQELKIAMFCTGCQSVSDFSRSQKVWKWRKSLKM